MPFDPRGLYFLDPSSLLINDADPSVLLAPPSAFTTPEPGSARLVALALILIGALRRLGGGAASVVPFWRKGR
jgi:hypothetical protein